MSGQWKPGDVAMVTWPMNCDGAFPVVRGKSRWYALDDVRRPHDDDFLTDEFLDRLNATIRPLVVIDPESEDADRLADMLTQSLTADDVSEGFRFATRAALREFANPTPPKPEEPTGLGAVVRDRIGQMWTRTDDAHYPWFYAAARFTYADIDAVEVLSEGVTNV